jgi:hypothetical protein
MIAGAALRHIPALHEGRFDPDAYLAAIDRAVRHSVPEPSAIIVNFPSNPTAQVCDLDFYRALVKFARAHGIWLLSDLAYAEIYFDDTPPPSILQVEGAKECAVEFTSLSKTYSMPGWRMGFAVGNERLIAALARIKSYLDYGAFTPVQVAAAAALNGPQDCVAEIRATTRAAATCWSRRWARRAGRSPRRRRPCSPGRRCPRPSPDGLDGFRQDAADRGRRRRVAGRRLRRVRRGLRAHRAGRERAAHPSGRARREEALRPRRRDPGAQRRRS